MNETHFYTPEPRKARVEIIPLIDVIFFLLATFVLFTLSLQKIGVLETVLPTAGKETRIEDHTVYIQASEHGTFYWKEGQLSAAEPISAREIRPRLLDYKRREAVPRVLVRGDNKASLGPAVMLLDEVRKAGISQVSVETVVSATGS